MENPSILIIDQNPQDRKLLSITLKAHEFSVLEAETDYEALFFFTNNRPKLLLLDLKMSIENRLFSIAKLREHYPSIIIVLSDKETESKIAKAIHDGASDFLLKPFRTHDVLTRVGLALREISREEPLHKKDSTLNFLHDINKEEDSLSESEITLLSLLMNHEGRLITQRTLVERLFGGSMENGPQRLLTLISQLRNKVEIDPNRPTHIISEQGIGYRFIRSPHNNS